MTRESLTRYAWLSIVAAVLTIGLKVLAFLLTESIGLLSDALESIVNLVGALMALTVLIVAARPPDDDHAYGHGKAEYFSSVVEGTLILIAAAAIAVAAAQRLVSPHPLDRIGLGLVVSMIAAIPNFIVAVVLARAGKRHQSITLEANAHHLFTDVWTSVGVVVGVGAAAITGLEWLDAVVALVVAANIVWTGVRIVKRSVSGLMDAALPPAEQKVLQATLHRYVEAGIQFHALRTRQAGHRRFMAVHVLVPGEWTVLRGHQLSEQIEADIRGALPNMTVLTHLEPLDDPVSWDDVALDRGPKA